MPNNEIVPARSALASIEGTSKYRPISRQVRPQGGVQLVFRFPNGYGASIINGLGSYGYELAVAKFTGPGDDDWDLNYDTPLTDNVLGWLDAEEIEAALDQLAALPAKQHEVSA